MNRAIKIVTLLLMGLISGCGNDNNNNIPTDNDIIGAGVSSGGMVICCVGVDQSPHDDHIPQVAFNGTNYLVVYEETDTGHDIIGAVISSAGTSYISISVSNDDRAPRVASDGVNFLVVYEETGTGNSHNIIGKRVDSNGNVLDPSGILIDTTNDDVAPAVAFGGGSYLVVYERDATVTTPDHNIIGRLVSTSGGVVGSEIQIDTTVLDDIAPSVASRGSDFLVAYERVFSTHDDIRGAVVNASGPTVTAFPIDTSLTTDDRAPAVASNGTKYLVAYQRVFNTDDDIREAIVDTTGLTPSVNLYPIDTSGFDDVAPAVASDGSSYFVVYEEVF